jgi:hypothetical protein
MERETHLTRVWAVRKCRLNPFRTGDDSDMMMRRLWLAVALGVILGFGVTVIPSSIGPEQKTNPLMVTSGAQPRLEASIPSFSQIQLVLVAVLAGLVLAVLVFLIAKRRS